MADIPANGRRVVFDMRITLGNLLTIASGCFVAAGLIYKAGTFQGSIESLRSDVAQIKCDLASAGIGSTTAPCTFYPRVGANNGR